MSVSSPASSAWARLLTVLRAMMTAQAAGDDAAVLTVAHKVGERAQVLRGIVEAGLGLADGGAGHPAQDGQSALLARDVFTSAQQVAVGIRAWQGVIRSTRDAAAATTCGGLWWESTLAVPADVASHWPAVLSLGSGALSRRTGVAATGSGELVYVGEPGPATDMVMATGWLLILLEGGHLCAATFTTADVAWLTSLTDEMRRT